MAVPVIESSTTVNSATSSWSPTQPTGLAVDDLILIVVASDYSNSNTFNSLTGQGFSEVIAAGNSADVQGALYYKIADSSDVSSWSVGPITQSTSADTCGWCFRISGVDTTTPIDVTPSWFGVGSTHASDINITGVTTVTDDALVIGFAATDGSDITPNSTPTAGWTFQAELENPTGDSGGCGVGYFTKTQATAGATGTLEADFSQAGTDGAIGVQIAVRPSSGGAQSISLAQIDASATLYSPTVAVGSVTITLAQLDASATLHNPSVAVSGGVTTVEIGLIDASGTAHAPDVVAGAIPVSVDLLDASASVNAPTLAETVTTFLYTPPTSAGPRPLPYESTAELRRKGPRKLNPTVTMGLTVLLNGSTYTSTALPTTAEIKAADAVYMGGRSHTVDSSVKAAIEASGVGGTFEQVA